MKLTHIKQAVINKTHKGSNSGKNNYRINVTNQYRTIVGNRKFKLSIKDNNYGINETLLNHVKQVWTSKGYSIKQFNKIGIKKVMEVLNNDNM